MITVKKFGATWCGPCRAIAPVLESLKAEYEASTDNVKFFEYDVDESPEEAAKYGVSSIPVVFIEKDGEVVNKIIGANSKTKYIEAINTVLD
jgi:thioredoxin 1